MFTLWIYILEQFEGCQLNYVSYKYCVLNKTGDRAKQPEIKISERGIRYSSIIRTIIVPDFF